VAESLVAPSAGYAAECKKFYESQVHLSLGAIDSGVRAVVNETVPASIVAEREGGSHGKLACLSGTWRSWALDL